VHDLIPDLLAGAAAGYGIAIPVGAIAILILDTGIRRGMRPALAAGAGAATADGVYAALAALFGLTIARIVGPVALPVRVVSVIVLLALGLRGLLAAWRSRGSPRMAAAPGPAFSAGRTYLAFLGLTLLNPMTIVYFTALVLGLPALGSTIGGRAAFALGAFVASLSWQSILAVTGSVLHHRLSRRAQEVLSMAGNLIILGFAGRIAAGLVM